MERFRKALAWREGTGEQVTIGEFTLIHKTRALILRLPFGGAVWNRPTGVVIQRGDQTQRIPIVDVTRLLQGMMLATCAGCWLGYLVFGRWNRKRAEEK